MADLKVKRPKTGGRKVGSLNKTTHEIRTIAQRYGGLAIDTLLDVMQNAKSDTARIAAATTMLDRAYGKPTQAVEIGEGKPDTRNWPTLQICTYYGVTEEQWRELQQQVKEEF